MIKTLDWVEQLINWFWLNRDRILKEVDENKPLIGGYFGFHVYYPEFGGLPQNVHDFLSERHVELLNQHAVFMLSDYPDERDFKRKFVAVLTNDTVTLS